MKNPNYLLNGKYSKTLNNNSLAKFTNLPKEGTFENPDYKSDMVSLLSNHNAKYVRGNS